MTRPRLPFRALCLLVAGLASPAALLAGDGDLHPRRLRLQDVFELEYASDPQIAPDGRSVVYVRNSMDIMNDRGRGKLWLVDADGGGHRPVTSGNRNDSSPRFSPDGTRLLYLSRDQDSTELSLRWLATGDEARLAQLRRRPTGLTFSPDGEWIAFSMLVPESSPPMVSLPGKPEGAQWAPDPVVIEKLIYRADGAGYLEDGYRQLFVLPTEGGTPRQITDGPFQHAGPPVFTPDGEFLLFSANRHEERETDPNNTEIYEVRLVDGAVRALTRRHGPDTSPTVSPDGRRIAYLGFDDEYQGYQLTRLFVMDRDGTNSRLLTRELDRSVESPLWSRDGEGVFFSYSDNGNTKLAYVTLDGNVEVLAEDLGGTSLGRPYSGGSFSVSRDGHFAYTHSRPHHPADVAVGHRGSAVRLLTRLNADLLEHRELGEVEEIHYNSSHDDRRIQGWIVKPPGFDPSRRYPLILEIHGGPFANYGDRFSAEIQLYAAAGYVVLYTNPRGSTSYGQEFGNLIHHAYPGDDYHDLMSGVDAVVARGYVDPENLFVTGGSGGGVLTAWIVGHTDRFSAAVAAKPVINWYSFVLTADRYNFFHKYWFPQLPWDEPGPYLERSPLSHVGKVRTPTMLLTGEVDYRTPISESEQFYQALKLRQVDAALVRIPGASHGIAQKPSHLMTKVAHILAWFERYRDPEPMPGRGGR